MKIKFVKGSGIQFQKTCKECDDKYWTPFLFNKICLNCKFRNSKLWQKRSN